MDRAWEHYAKWNNSGRERQISYDFTHIWNILKIKINQQGFPGGPVVKSLLATQGLLVQSLVQEDPTCSGATKLMHHNYWNCALEPISRNYWSLSAWNLCSAIREGITMGSLCSTTKSSPCSSQLEKALTQQRPTTVKKTWTETNIQNAKSRVVVTKEEEAGEGRNGYMRSTVQWQKETKFWWWAYCSAFVVVQSLSHLTFWDSLQTHEQQHDRLPSLSPYPRICSDSCPLCQWSYPTISSSVASFSSCLQSSPALGSFLMSQLFPSSGQSIGASALASVLPMIIDWFPLGLTSWISLLSKGLKIFSSTTVQKHQFFNTQPSLWSNSHIHTWLLEKP